VKSKVNSVKKIKHFAILTASVVASSLAANTAVVAGAKSSEPASSDRIYNVQVAEKSDRNLSNSKGTLKEGSAISIDPAEIIGIPKAEARQLFILNKIYRVQEGNAADDLFIVDEKANKWAVEDVSEATMGPVTHSLALMVSGNGRVWALIQQF
jgi:hypothetical protein